MLLLVGAFKVPNLFFCDRACQLGGPLQKNVSKLLWPTLGERPGSNFLGTNLDSFEAN
jgi:hypothetical protein